VKVIRSEAEVRLFFSFVLPSPSPGKRVRRHALEMVRGWIRRAKYLGKKKHIAISPLRIRHFGLGTAFGTSSNALASESEVSSGTPLSPLFCLVRDSPQRNACAKTPHIWLAGTATWLELAWGWLTTSLEFAVCNSGKDCPIMSLPVTSTHSPTTASPLTHSHTIEAGSRT